MSEQDELGRLGAEAEAEDKPEVVEGEYVPGGEQASETVMPETGEVLAPVLQIGFGLIASRRGDHWALSDIEAVEVGNALGAVVDKYLPDVKVGPELTLVVVALAVVGPRVGEDRRQEAERVKEGADSGEESKREQGE